MQQAFEFAKASGPMHSRVTKSQDGNRNRLVLKMRQLNQSSVGDATSLRLNTQQNGYRARNSSNTQSLAAINEKQKRP